MQDNIIAELVNSKLWYLDTRRTYENPNLFRVKSNMKGYSDGRYRLEITKLKRKIEGCIYKISIFWTPYDPYDLKFKGRFNSFDELQKIISSVNKDLLDISRVYN